MKPALKYRSVSLDQWRGWAMILVLINHSLKHTGYVEGLGRAGVNLFFVISGYLTAKSLLSISRKGDENLFILPLKRLWRLYPVCLFYIVVVYLLVEVTDVPRSAHLNVFLPFYANYINGFHWISHLWSIACELHFYLISPFFLFLEAVRVS